MKRWTKQQQAQWHLDNVTCLMHRVTKQGCSAFLFEIVNSIWDWDFRVSHVSITRQVADALGFDPEETEREVGIGARQTRNPILMEFFACPVLLKVAELPEGMLMQTEGLLTYPVWLDETPSK
jgi:hypothetical protein